MSPAGYSLYWVDGQENSTKVLGSATNKADSREKGGTEQFSRRYLAEGAILQ